MDLDEDRPSIAIHTDRLRLTNESAADSRDSDPRVPDRADVATNEEAAIAKLRMS